MATFQAVIFDYGGVLRGDDRGGFDAVDKTFGFPQGALWSAFHDIPEYRLSRRGEIDADTFRAAVRRNLMSVAGEESCADAALAALDQYMGALAPIDAEMRALVVRLRAAGRVKLGLLSNASRGWTERLRARGARSRGVSPRGPPARRRAHRLPHDRRPAAAPGERATRGPISSASSNPKAFSAERCALRGLTA